MANIKLTPAELLQQSTQMSSIQSELQSLFSQVTSCLNQLNDSWSEALASNFTSKITAVQKSFSGVADMMENAATAARVGANTFAEPGAVLSLICGDTGSISIGSLVSSWFSEYTSEDGAEFDVDLVIGELSKMTGVDSSTAKDVFEKISDGDYEGAVQSIADKGIDLVAETLAGDFESDTWVGELEELTGGTLNLSSLKKDYYKNLITDSGENLANIGSALASGDYGTAVEQVGELAWNSTAGSLIKTGLNNSVKVVESIPGIGDYYKEKGVTDYEGAVSSMIGDVVYTFTGDSEAAAQDANYYSEHGGIVSGIVDGVTDISSFVGEQISSFWSSVVGK